MKKNLLEFYRNGIRIYLENGKLKYNAEPGKMTQERKTWLKNNKEKVKAFIQQQSLQVYSEALEEEIYFIRGQEYAHLVPPGKVAYTLEELENLTRKWPERELLRNLHRAKKNFNGEVI